MAHNGLPQVINAVPRMARSRRVTMVLGGTIERGIVAATNGIEAMELVEDRQAHDIGRDGGIVDEAAATCSYGSALCTMQ